MKSLSDSASAFEESKPMPLSQLYDEALVYAARRHRDQLRKGSATPYIAHLLSVSSRVLSAGGTEVQAIRQPEGRPPAGGTRRLAV
jgi:(p)ppGpp synthase/HD superfamily hydrolase